MEDGLNYYTHTNVLFHIVMHTQLAEMGQGPPTCKLGGGARVRVVGNGRQECLAT